MTISSFKERENMKIKRLFSLKNNKSKYFDTLKELKNKHQNGDYST